MSRMRVDRRFPVLLLGPCLIAVCASAVAAENPHRNPLRTPAGPPTAITPTAAAAPTAQLASYVTEPMVTQYVTDDYCDAGVACDSPAMCGPAPCGPGYPYLPLWGGIEYLLWWEKDSNLPALVTTSTAGTDRDAAGILGEPGTSVLFGGDSIDGDTVSGGRLTIGTWIDPGFTTGLGVRLFGMEDNSVNFAADSDEFPILARPFFNVFTDEEDALLLGFPAELEGDIQVEMKTETTGAQAFVRQWLRSGCNYRIDFVYGYRYLQVQEWLTIDNRLEFVGAEAPNFGTEITQQDHFEAENDYNGGEIGLMGQSVDGPWTLDFLATIAFGEMRERVTISGSTVATPPSGGPAELVGGLLTQQSNIGTYEQSPFTVIPEASVTIGYFITPSLNLTIGYSFLYVNNIARTGRMVDTSVNLTQQTGDLEGPARPEFQFKESDYWLQGLNFGLDWRF